MKKNKGADLKSRLCKMCEACKAAVFRTVCYKCKSRLYAQRHPVKRVFFELKRSAKRRGLEFSITLAELQKLVIPTGYMELKGREAKSLTINRIKNEHGYISGNLEVITKSKNSISYHEYKAMMKKRNAEIDKEMPF